MSKQNAIDFLKMHLKSGDNIYTPCRKVSESGMSRSFQVFIVIEGEIRDISYHIEKACEMKIDKNNYLIIRGCGMDMSKYLATEVARAIFQDTNALNRVSL